MKHQDISVLIIDDDAILRSLMGSLLRQEGYQVVGDASSAESGMRMFEQYQPKAVLLDINLPGMDGLTMLSELRRESESVKVIMVSGDATLDRVRSALSSGASGFVVKPINANKLLSAIEFAFKE
ncbi:response regulator [Leeia oryzae]|uniref:response regulator n=1 Tax=Leeia oryzae TaxID=356662 RepID=UPI0003629833|nr:response regulator [Leeia oryzae]